MLSAPVSDLLLELVLDFLGELFHLVALEVDALFLEDLDDVAAGLVTLVGGYQEAYCCAGDGAAYYGGDYVNRLHSVYVSCVFLLVYLITQKTRQVF